MSRFDGNTRIMYITANCLASNDIYARAADSTGNKWFGTMCGMRRGGPGLPGSPSPHPFHVHHHP